MRHVQQSPRLLPEPSPSPTHEPGRFLSDRRRHVPEASTTRVSRLAEAARSLWSRRCSALESRVTNGALARHYVSGPTNETCSQGAAQVAGRHRRGCSRKPSGEFPTGTDYPSMENEVPK